MSDDRGLVPSSLGETTHWEKSPFIQGFIAGFKGALMGAPAGAAVQAIRGKDPIIGALIGGLGVGVLSGVARASAKKLESVSAEEAMRYHILQMKGREPFVFMPPSSLLQKALLRMREGE